MKHTIVLSTLLLFLPIIPNASAGNEARLDRLIGIVETERSWHRRDRAWEEVSRLKISREQARQRLLAAASAEVEYRINVGYIRGFYSQRLVDAVAHIAEDDPDALVTIMRKGRSHTYDLVLSGLAIMRSHAKTALPFVREQLRTTEINKGRVLSAIVCISAQTRDIEALHAAARADDIKVPYEVILALQKMRPDRDVSAHLLRSGVDETWLRTTTPDDAKRPEKKNAYYGNVLEQQEVAHVLGKNDKKHIGRLAQLYKATVRDKHITGIHFGLILIAADKKTAVERASALLRDLPVFCSATHLEFLDRLGEDTYRLLDDAVADSLFQSVKGMPYHDAHFADAMSLIEWSGIRGTPVIEKLVAYAADKGNKIEARQRVIEALGRIAADGHTPLIKRLLTKENSDLRDAIQRSLVEIDELAAREPYLRISKYFKAPIQR